MDAMSRVFGERPDRPDHPDFWRMSEVVLGLDSEAMEDGKDIPRIADGRIDMETLEYMAEHRVGTFLEAIGVKDMPPFLVSLLETMFVTSIITGIEFERRGGHRDDTPST